MGSEPKMPEPFAFHNNLPNCPLYTGKQMRDHAAGIRAAVLAEVVTKLVESGQPLAAAIVTTLEQQP